MSNTTNPDPHAFVLSKVTIFAARQSQTLDITTSVVELELYENINSLTLHGSLTFVDTAGIFEAADFSGTEAIFVNAHIPDSPSDKWTRMFYATKVVKGSKASDNVEAFTIQLMDVDSYKNNINNISRAYSGKISDCLTSILMEVWPTDNRRVMVGTQTIQEPIKYIVPNITPYEAMKVLTNRATGASGTPYYLYSSLSDRNIRFFDLKELLDHSILNQQSYIYSAAHVNMDEGTPVSKSYHISHMDLRETEDMMSLIKNGDIGARYEYINTAGGYVDEYHHDASKVFENVWNRSNQKQLAPVFDPIAQVGGKYLSEATAVNVSQITTSGVFEDFPSLNEDLSELFHRSKSVSKSLRNFIRKSAITITVPGRNFFPLRANHTISNKLNITVLANTDISESMSDKQKLDMKRSGDYIVLAAKHNFNNVSKKYSVTMKLGKLGNREGQTTASRTGYGLGQVDPALAKAAGGL